MQNKLKTLNLRSCHELEAAVEAPLDNLIQLFKYCNFLEVYCQNNNLEAITLNQFGVNYKILVSKNSEKSFSYYINCSYQPLGSMIQSLERCPCLDKLARIYRLTRFDSILLSGYQLIDANDLELVAINLEKVGQEAVLLQHEIDHFFGCDKLVSVIGQEVQIF
jgi:peptide deformylase